MTDDDSQNTGNDNSNGTGKDNGIADATGNEPPKPSQIPLLDDVIPEGKLPRRRRSRKRENLTLDLDPEPPEILDLFDNNPTSAAENHSPTFPSQPVDDKLRAHADEMVERLVQEYAREMVSKLRSELSQLLSELDEEQQAPKVWDGPPISDWHPWFPVELQQRLASTGANWSVVGGWAIDLFLGKQTREHADIEIAIPRLDYPMLLPFFADCDLFTAKDGETRRLRPDDPVPDDVHQIWVAERRSRAWRLDIMLEPGNPEIWAYRRNPDIQAQRGAMTLRRNTIPYLAPEGLLLYKSKAYRIRDQKDFDLCLPALSDERRGWLAEAIGSENPGHVWLESL